MALAVTHILVAIVILDLIRHYITGKTKFPRYLLVVGGIAGLAPDIDIPLSWIISWTTGTEIGLHRLFTHSIFFVVLFLLIGIIRQYQDDPKWAKIFYVIAAGWFIHLLLDCAYGSEPLRSFFWPYIGGGLICPRWNLYPWAESIDAVLLVIWLVHEEVHQRIKDYF